MKNTEFLYHYSPEEIQIGTSLEPGTWLTDTKGAAVSEKISKLESSSDHVIFEYLVWAPKEVLKRTTGHRRKKVDWYQVVRSDESERKATIQQRVRKTSYQEMRQQLLNY